MPKTIGFLYSTVDGHTRAISERLAAIVEAKGISPKLIEITGDSNIDLAPFDQIVIGASIRYGKHRPDVVRLIQQNRESLESKAGAFFSVNAVARKADKKSPETNPYVRKLLANIEWQPAAIGIFAGRIHYAKYGFLDRTMIRFIMWMTKGPTNLESDTDFTDWDDVDRFGAALVGLQK